MTTAPVGLSAAAKITPVIEMHGIGVAYSGQLAPAGAGSTARLPWRRRPRHRRCSKHDKCGQTSCVRCADRRPADAWSGRPAAALSGVELTVSAGEFVTLTGPASAGLSTLLAVAGLLLRPSTGSYFLNGADTAKLGERDLAALRGRAIGLMLTPTPLLPGRSVLDNVMLPLLYAAPPGRSGRPGRVRQDLALACLDRVGLGAMAGVQAGTLSAGQRQRAAIARALVTSPGLLLLDDPTASLDPSGAAEVVALLTDLHSEGKTVVVAARDQLAAAYSSRCVPIGTSRPDPSGHDPARHDPSGHRADPGGGEHRTDPRVAR